MPTQAPSEPTLPRRQALRRLAAGSALALGIGAAAPALAKPSSKKGAKKRSKIRDIYKGKRGTTIWMDLESAPFPHKSAKYTDPTVIVFVPHHFRVHRDMKADTLMHFHGHRDTAERAMKRHHLREQLAESKQNAILIMPQGPVRAEDSNGGKLDEDRGMLNLLTEVRKTLQKPRISAALGPAALPGGARIGKLLLSAHSGGYRVLANCLERGGFNVNEVYLFDSLYARVSTFRDWVAAAREHDDLENRHKLISYYSGEELTRNNLSLMRHLERLEIGYLHETKEGTLSRKDITKARCVFIKTAVEHQDTLYRYNQLRDCLFASCLTRYLKSDWFENKKDPRALEKRPKSAKK